MSEQEGTITTARAAARKKSMPVEAASPMAALADDVLLQILARLEGDPRDWARAACVSPRLAVLLRGACFPPRLARALPAELLPPPSDAPEAWAALQKLSVCCPGLMRAGVLLEPSDDFGLELDIGPDHSFSPPRVSKNLLTTTAESKNQSTITAESKNLSTTTASSLDAGVAWSLYDDLYLDAAYDSSEAQIPTSPTTSAPDPGASGVGVVAGSRRRPRRWLGPVGAHLASGSWTLSREQGNKLLASRFRGDRLYICDWPGCVHAEERRKYMVFRGVFQNFERSQVRRTLRDTRRPTVAVECAFCACKETWDLYSAFCLRSFYGFHDDGEPVVRAYVCANGHVAGAWTERPMYA